MRWAGHGARMGELRGACRVFVGKLEGKRLLGRYRRRWEDNIKMHLEPSASGRLQVLPSGKETRFAPLLTVPPEAIIWALPGVRRSERQWRFPEFSFEVTILVLFIRIRTLTLTPARTQTWNRTRSPSWIHLVYF